MIYSKCKNLSSLFKFDLSKIKNHNLLKLYWITHHLVLLPSIYGKYHHKITNSSFIVSSFRTIMVVSSSIDSCSYTIDFHLPKFDFFKEDVSKIVISSSSYFNSIIFYIYFKNTQNFRSSTLYPEPIISKFCYINL